MTTPIRAMIVDDEEPGRVNLRYALAEHANWLVVAECANVATSRTQLAAQVIDVIFLDVQMPRENGLALARDLSLQAEPPLIIFVTAFNEHAIEAFELHALDYLLKPLDDQRLANALERAQAMLTLRQQANYGKAMRNFIQDEDEKTAVPNAQKLPSYWQQVSVRSVGKIECIQLSDVLWIEAQGNYMQLHLATRNVLYRASISQLEKHLDPAHFIRIHRSTLVRKEQIVAMRALPDSSYQLQLRCGDEVTVSERYYAAVKIALSVQ
jgi:two-component system LytT family response regulator